MDEALNGTQSFRKYFRFRSFSSAKEKLEKLVEVIPSDDNLQENAAVSVSDSSDQSKAFSARGNFINLNAASPTESKNVDFAVDNGPHDTILFLNTKIQSHCSKLTNLLYLFLAFLCADFLVSLLLFVTLLYPCYPLWLLLPTRYAPEFSLFDILLLCSIRLIFLAVSYLVFIFKVQACSNSIALLLASQDACENSESADTRAEYMQIVCADSDINHFPSSSKYKRRRMFGSHPTSVKSQGKGLLRNTFSPYLPEENKDCADTKPASKPSEEAVARSDRLNDTNLDPKVQNFVNDSVESCFSVLLWIFRFVSIFIYVGLLKVIIWSYRVPSQLPTNISLPFYSASHLLVVWNLIHPIAVLVTLLFLKVRLKALRKCAEEFEHCLQTTVFSKSIDKEEIELQRDVAYLKEDYHSWLSWREKFRILMPYFWPTGGVDNAGRRILLRFQALATWICVSGSKITSIISPMYLGAAAEAIISNDWSLALKNLAIYSLLLLVSKILKESQSLLYLKVAQHAYIEISEHAYGHVHNLSVSWHLKKKIGSVLRSIDRGVSAANTLMSFGFLSLIPALFECIAVVFIFLFHFNNSYLVITLSTSLVVYILATMKLTIWRAKFRKESNLRDNKFHDIANDALTNFESVKCFTNEAFEINRFSQEIKGYQAYGTATRASLNLLNIMQQAIQQLGIFAALCITSLGIIRNNMKFGDFVSVNTYMLNVFAPLNILGSIYYSIIQALVDLQNISQLLAERPEIVDVADAVSLCLSPIDYFDDFIIFKNVCFRYTGQPHKNALQNISFSIPYGKTVAVVGSTGSGKSTLSRLLFRFYNVTSGQILVNGQDISQVKQKSLREAIGIVPQDTVLFNESLLYNLLYGRPDASIEEVENAVEAVQLKEFIKSLPNNFDTIIGERGLKLSGGEKQRMIIARCLLKNPPIVVLDEATNALDLHTESLIQKTLNNLSFGRTVLVIAHRLSSVQNAHQIMVLRKGMIVERGTHMELLLKKGEYYRMWLIQQRGEISDDEKK